MKISEQSTQIDDDEFIRLFEAGEDIDQYLDLDNVRRPGIECRTIAFDLQKPDYDLVAQKAANSGVSPQQLVTTWVVERAKALV